MKHTDILRRSWHILWQYRWLWLFGFVIALTTLPLQGSLDWNDQWEPNQGMVIRTEDRNVTVAGPDVLVDLLEDGLIVIRPRGGGAPSYIHTKGGLEIELSPAVKAELDKAAHEIATAVPPDVTHAIIGSLVAVLIVAAGIIVLATILRYPAEAALIKGVNEHSETGKKASFRELVRLGWSRTAWRFFLIDVAVRLPLFIFFLILFGLSLSPLLLWLAGDLGAGIFGTVTSAGLLIFSLILAFVISILLGIFMQFFRRACALENLGVTASVARGLQVIRHNFKDTFLMALLLLAVIIAFIILFIPLMIVLFPTFIVSIITGGLAALAILFPASALAQLVVGDVVAWVFAGAVALAVFIPIVAAPITFVRGLLEVFLSSSWTLTYREMLALEAVKPVPAPKAKAALA